MSQDIDDIGAINDTGDEPTSIRFESQQGKLSIENDEIVRTLSLDDCIIGVQVSDDGRVWLCVNGVAWVRFKPHRKGTNHA